MNISYSRVSSYLSCPYKHYLGYSLGLRPNKPARPLCFGSDFHKLLELRNDPEALAGAKKDIGEKYYALKPQWQGALGENYIVDLACIFEDYLDVYKDAPNPSVTEEPFELKIGDVKGEPIIFKGVIDELYKSRTKAGKQIKVGEHKTFSRKPDMNTLVMNTQKCLYAKAVHILYDMLPKSVIWDYINSTPAASPIWLEKSQRFSSAKSEKITPYSYIRACQERNITDNTVLEEAKKYEANVQNFFFRCELPILPRMVDNIWEGFVYTARDIVSNGCVNKTKNITRDCSWCNFQPLCFTELTGGDVQYLIDKDFVCHPREDVIKLVEEE